MDPLMEKIAQLAILRTQFERQMLHVRVGRNMCSCANRGRGKRGQRDDYRTDIVCDMCGPFVTGFHKARTGLDQAVTDWMQQVKFDPESKADEFMTRLLADYKQQWKEKEALNV